MILHDQHIHTKYSEDSNAEIRDYFEKISKMGIKYFICCDHTDLDTVINKVDWRADYEACYQEALEISKDYPEIKVLRGAEIGYRKDKLQEINRIIQQHDFDLINLSIHDNGIYDYYMRNIFTPTNHDEIMNTYLDNIYDALINMDNFDVLSHIDYGFKTLKLVDDKADFFKYEDKIREIMKLLIKKNKTLEINSKVQIFIDDNHLRRLLKLYYSLGGRKVSLSSDSHEVKMYYYNFDKYMKIIKECGFDYLSYFIKRKEYLYKI